jgi:hypothetical protein
LEYIPSLRGEKKESEMEDVERERIITLAKNELARMDAVSKDFHPIWEKCTVLETPMIPGPMVIALLRAPAEAIDPGTTEYCLEYFGYIPETGTIHFIDYQPVATLREAEVIINHYQAVAARDRAEKEAL